MNQSYVTHITRPINKKRVSNLKQLLEHKFEDILGIAILYFYSGCSIDINVLQSIVRSIITGNYRISDSLDFILGSYFYIENTLTSEDVINLKNNIEATYAITSILEKERLYKIGFNYYMNYLGSNITLEFIANQTLEQAKIIKQQEKEVEEVKFECRVQTSLANDYKMDLEDAEDTESYYNSAIADLKKAHKEDLKLKDSIIKVKDEQLKIKDVSIKRLTDEHENDQAKIRSLEKEVKDFRSFIEQLSNACNSIKRLLPSQELFAKILGVSQSKVSKGFSKDTEDIIENTEVLDTNNNGIFTITDS